MARVARLIVLVSGSGSNLQALINATRDGTLTAEIVLVVSNRPDAYGLQRARLAGIDTLPFPLKPYSVAGESREDYDADLAKQLKHLDPNLIVLAGWKHVLSPAFLDKFPGQVINIHCTLPGNFNGVDAVERAYEAYQAGEIDHSGCSVRYVLHEVDAGPLVAQNFVPFRAGESFDDFELRMHAAEHQLIVRATRLALAETTAIDEQSRGPG